MRTMKKVRANILPYQANIKHDISHTQILQRRKTLWTAASIGSAIIGLLLIAGGFVLSLTAYLESDADTVLNSRLGGFLLLAAFPVFFFAAHALDKIALVKKAEKAEAARQHNFYK